MAGPQWEKDRYIGIWGHWFILVENLALNFLQNLVGNGTDHCQEGCSIPGLQRKGRGKFEPLIVPKITQQRSSKRSAAFETGSYSAKHSL